MEAAAARGQECIQISVRGLLSGTDGGVHQEMVSFIFIVSSVQLLKPHEKCVSVGMLSSFMVTHTQCWCAGMSACWEGSLVKLLCFFLHLGQSCLDLIGKSSTSTPKSVFSPKEGKTKSRIQQCCWEQPYPLTLPDVWNKFLLCILSNILYCISFLVCETILF